MPSPEASRRNGRLGGRHKKPPQLVPEMRATRKRNIELRELCKVNDAKHVATLEWLAANSESHSVRIQAIALLWDRGHGKAPQPHDGDGAGGPIVFNVITGVPPCDDTDVWPPWKNDYDGDKPELEVRPLPASPKHKD